MIITWSTTSGVVFFIWPSEGIYTLAISHKIPAVYVSAHWTRAQETLNVKLSDSLNYPEHLKILCLAQGHLGSVAEGREGELAVPRSEKSRTQRSVTLKVLYILFALIDRRWHQNPVGGRSGCTIAPPALMPRHHFRLVSSWGQPAAVWKPASICRTWCPGPLKSRCSCKSMRDVRQTLWPSFWIHLIFYLIKINSNNFVINY